MRKLLPPLALTLLLSGCGASGPSQSVATAAGGSCDDLQTSASSLVQRVIASHAARVSDADCVVVGVAAGCFDHCSRAMNADGQRELETAKDQVNGAQCHAFEERGCKFFSPPCMAPPPPRCRSGSCV